ncbi:conserved hypothetical protein [Methylobacterium sp. 4-46]|uniref:DUF2336 domain-containing protein n=1 Tax=unclassified Methylobacterium TaxID=2615210 RepID=UPI000152DF88|nr:MULTISPECIES: DUF2336 domain-containing protein [Methylobacterium]ACA15648.1 conserved hypothetical protein [Methylobacterium sp. 4-46]WFT81360.1 DUF2336 domain-containing protein [Methylobacterium nodulans]
MSRPAVDALPDLSGLLELAQDRRLDMKPVLLRVQTDLFRAAPVRDPGTIRAFEALACGLIPTVDAATAALVAEKLAPLADTPESVLRLLAAHGGEARDAVLRLSPVLSTDLLDAAENGPALDAVIARRGDLSRALIEDLTLREDPAVDLALAGNRGARLDGPALARLVARARTRPDLAAALVARDDLPAVDLAPLYLDAPTGLRARIREGVAARAALRPLARPAPRGLGEALKTFALRGARERAEAELSAALGFAGVAWDFAAPRRHDLLALALRAAGLSEEEAVFLFLRLDPEIGRSVEAVFALANLFRTTLPATARDLLAAILGEEPAERVAGPEQHRPHHGPASPRLRPAAPALRPALPERVRRSQTRSE